MFEIFAQWSFKWYIFSFFYISLVLGVIYGNDVFIYVYKSVKVKKKIQIIVRLFIFKCYLFFFSSILYNSDEKLFITLGIYNRVFVSLIWRVMIIFECLKEIISIWTLAISSFVPWHSNRSNILLMLKWRANPSSFQWFFITVFKFSITNLGVLYRLWVMVPPDPCRKPFDAIVPSCWRVFREALNLIPPPCWEMPVSDRCIFSRLDQVRNLVESNQFWIVITIFWMI